ncbi:iron chelate uptake ABC transporter family permease subunit [Streptomyces sp. SID5789]|uniref:iron chelate uptake ABC transporter family permease subunit n=1 Tax=Streptomyces sp. SID5789 TaxID=2690310 RepID=UPI0031FF0DA5
MRRPARLGACLSTRALALAGCSSSPDSTDDAGRGGTGEATKTLLVASFADLYAKDRAGTREELAELELPAYVRAVDCPKQNDPEKTAFDLLFDDYANSGRIFGVEERAAKPAAEQRAVVREAEGTATSLGVDVTVVRRLLLVTAVLTAVAVASVGAIGFVGLIVPYGVRFVVGPLHRALLPFSALVGAIFLVWTDALARVAFAPQEVPVGVFTALLGVPLFLLVLRKRGEL